MTAESLMGKFFEWMTMAVIVWGLWHLARRLLRPKTTRELLGRPRSFFAYVQPVADLLAEERDGAARDDIKRDATAAFASGLEAHRLPRDEFELVFVVDEIEGEMAMVRRSSDGKIWRLNDFDDYLLSREAAPADFTAYAANTRRSSR
jgi:hypothetical protein